MLPSCQEVRAIAWSILGEAAPRSAGVRECLESLHMHAHCAGRIHTRYAEEEDAVTGNKGIPLHPERCMYLTHSVMHFARTHDITYAPTSAPLSAPGNQYNSDLYNPFQRCLHGVTALPAQCRHSVHRAGQRWMLTTTCTQHVTRQRVRSSLDTSRSCNTCYCVASQPELCSLATHSAGKRGSRVCQRCRCTHLTREG